jgi:hypothetical protein
MSRHCQSAEGDTSAGSFSRLSAPSPVDDKFFLSSVEILEPAVRYPSPVDGYDRTTGKGRGHAFVINRRGKLLKVGPLRSSVRVIARSATVPAAGGCRAGNP